jgi:hypothetical protein
LHERSAFELRRIFAAFADAEFVSEANGLGDVTDRSPISVYSPLLTQYARLEISKTLAEIDRDGWVDERAEGDKENDSEDT